MIDLAILWHMHQPLYQDPRTGEFVLPWVRLHAARAYYDMGRALEAQPEAKVHVNFVPSLLDQLEVYAEGAARDRWLELTVKPAADLDLEERELVWRRFFMVDWETEVLRIPRYLELLLRRGKDLARVDLPRLARESTADELRDLQVLFNLAWTGFALRAEDPALGELLRRGRGYTEDDKQVVLAAQRRAAQAVVPLYRALEARGQIELTTTPYFHPILPLLIDSESARAGLPDRHLPTPFRFPEDARWHVTAAVEAHQRRFGAPPAGMWPAEGSVSEEAAAVFAQAGVRWIASDEGVLLRSLPTPDRTAIQQPHRLETPHGAIDIVFRDRGLSDLIGFTYARVPAPAAVEDFLGHLRSIDNAAKGERPLVSVILDGENPWEHYPQSGKTFLDALYAGLTSPRSPARTVRLRDALPERQPSKLARLHPGSWIDANFRIWIGHHEDVQAWEALGKVRRAMASRQGAWDPERWEKALRLIHVAEGSDWFWWFGDDFTTENAAEFDELFRDHLAMACDALGIPQPPEIAQPIAAAAHHLSGEDRQWQRAPTALIAPIIDGRISRFGEWSGAGYLRGGRGRGAMNQGEVTFSDLRYGFDAENLYLRLDPAVPRGLSSPGARLGIALELQTPAGVRSLRTPLAEGAVGQLAEGDGTRRLGAFAAADILEMRVPLSELNVGAGQRVELTVVVSQDGIERERLPSSGALVISIPGSEFEQVHWKV